MSTADNQYNQGQAPVYPLPQYQPWETLGNWGRMENGEPDPSPGPAPWAQRNKRRKLPTWAVVLILVGSLFLVCAGCIGAIVTGPDDTSVSVGTSDQPGEAVHQVGQKVQVGVFQYTVNKITCDIDRVGDKNLGQDAQGSYCKVDVTVRNSSRAPEMFHADTMIKARDATGNEFSADGFANIYGNEDNAAFLKEINPGNQVRAKIYFDIPNGAKLSWIELNDGGLFDPESAVVELK